MNCYFSSCVKTLILISLIFFTFRSIGYNREAEMIEQQLKMKQTTGQQVTLPTGKKLFTFLFYFVGIVNNDERNVRFSCCF